MYKRTNVLNACLRLHSPSRNRFETLARCHAAGVLFAADPPVRVRETVRLYGQTRMSRSKPGGLRERVGVSTQGCRTVLASDFRQIRTSEAGRDRVYLRFDAQGLSLPRKS
ncbi:hypothetical protein GCM10027448_01890 [Nocardioides dilutus]